MKGTINGTNGMNSRLRSLNSDQRGMVSFIVTFIMIIIITLIVIGFVQITRRNSRETLDRQLSSQAFYAAESGVNVTKTMISDYMATAGTYTGMTEKKTCATDYDPTDPNGMGSAIVPLSQNVGYTCILVDPSPTKLQYKLNSNQSVVVPLVSRTNGIKSVTLAWNAQAGAAATSCNGGDIHTLYTQTTYTCDSALMRVDLVTNPSGSAQLGTSSSTRTLYLTPYGGGGSYTVSGQKVQFAHATCSKGSGCTVTLLVPSADYYARIVPLYRDVPQLYITGKTTTGTDAEFLGAEAKIDSTGKAQDVLRRIAVFVSLSNISDQSQIPSNALSSGSDICKSFTIAPGDTLDFGAPAEYCPGTSPAAGPTGMGGGGGSSGSIGGNPNPNPGPNPNPIPNPNPFPGPHWGTTLWVHVAPDPSLVNYCIWNWDDGNTNTGSGAQCQPGDSSKIFHDYSPHDLKCHQYISYLYFHMKDGTVIRSNPSYHNVPWSSDPTFKCPYV